MKKLFLLLMAAIISTAVNATTATWSATSLSLINKDVINDVIFDVDENVSFTLAKGESTKDCVYAVSSQNPASVNLYSKGTITFNAKNGAKLTSIKFVVNTSEGTSNTPGWDLRIGDVVYNEQNNTWTGEESTVVFTDKSSVYIKGLQIEYAATEGTDPDAPNENKVANLFFNGFEACKGEAAQKITLKDNGVTIAFSSTSANAEIDNQNGNFGTAEDYVTFGTRYRAGGKSSDGIQSSTKAVMTFPCDGELIIYAYNNQTTSRRLQIVQDGNMSFDKTYYDTDVVLVGETKIYPITTTSVKAGTSYLLWPDNQLMLYGFVFTPKDNTSGHDNIAVNPTELQQAYDIYGRPVSDTYKGLVICGGKKYFRK